MRAIILTATLLVLAATSARAEFQICQHPFRPECSVSHVRISLRCRLETSYAAFRQPQGCVLSRYQRGSHGRAMFGG